MFRSHTFFLNNVFNLYSFSLSNNLIFESFAERYDCKTVKTFKMRLDKVILDWGKFQINLIKYFPPPKKKRKLKSVIIKISFWHLYIMPPAVRVFLRYRSDSKQFRLGFQIQTVWICIMGDVLLKIKACIALVIFIDLFYLYYCTYYYIVNVLYEYFIDLVMRPVLL